MLLSCKLCCLFFNSFQQSSEIRMKSFLWPLICPSDVICFIIYGVIDIYLGLFGIGANIFKEAMISKHKLSSCHIVK